MNVNILIQEYIKYLRIQTVALKLQTCRPHESIQHNALLGRFDVNEIDDIILIRIISDQLMKLRLIQTLPQLKQLLQYWKDQHLIIQYTGYGYGNDAKTHKSEAYGYIFLIRALRKNHKKLYKLINKVVD